MEGRRMSLAADERLCCETAPASRSAQGGGEPLVTPREPRPLPDQRQDDVDRSASASPVRRPSSCTAVTSASISIGRPSSRSCSIEVLCAPTCSAPAMRLSTSIGNFTPSAAAIVSASTIIARATARVPASRAISSSVPPVSAEIGLKERLPQSLTQMSLRMSGRIGARMPAATSARESAVEPLALLARRLAERQPVALDVANDARRFDLRGDVDDAADGALRLERLPDRCRRDRPPRRGVLRAGRRACRNTTRARRSAPSRSRCRGRSAASCCRARPGRNAPSAPGSRSPAVRGAAGSSVASTLDAGRRRPCREASGRCRASPQGAVRGRRGSPPPRPSRRASRR